MATQSESKIGATCVPSKKRIDEYDEWDFDIEYDACDRHLGVEISIEDCGSPIFSSNIDVLVSQMMKDIESTQPDLLPSMRSLHMILDS